VADGLGDRMTVTTWLLLALAGVTTLGCVAFLLPDRRVDPHSFVTDPFELADDHVGRHERPDPDGATRRLLPPTMRFIPDQDQ
jgi:hypothetical protein